MNKSTIVTQSTKEANALAKAEATRKANAIKDEATAKAEAEARAQNIEAIKQADEAKQKITFSNGDSKKDFYFNPATEKIEGLDKKIVFQKKDNGDFKSAYVKFDDKTFSFAKANNDLTISELFEMAKDNQTQSQTKTSSAKISDDIAYTVPKSQIEYERVVLLRFGSLQVDAENKMTRAEELFIQAKAELEEIKKDEAKAIALTAGELDAMREKSEQDIANAKKVAAEKIETQRKIKSANRAVEKLTEAEKRALIEQLTNSLK